MIVGQPLGMSLVNIRFNLLTVAGNFSSVDFKLIIKVLILSKLFFINCVCMLAAEMILLVNTNTLELGRRGEQQEIT